MSVAGLLAVAVVWAGPCDGPDATSWVAAFRDRVLSYDALAAFAVAEFGAPVACEGDVTTEFDGADYGILVLTFGSGVSLRVETQPIETSIVTLRAPGGFEDPATVETALREYTEGIGVAIDWDAGRASAAGAETVTTYRDPDPGLNASAELLRSGPRLVAVRFAMAL